MTNPDSVLVTGCSSGIGECVAHGLKARGYRVFATVRNAADTAELEANGIETLLLDYDSSDSIREAAARVLDATGGQLYGLFNNGAYGQPGACEDLSRDALRRQFETNVFGWVELTNCLIPAMRRNARGRIIQNSSILGFAAMKMRGAYNASKFAIEGFSDTLRLELRGSGVHVCLIEPGPITSAFRANAYRAFQDNIDWKNSVHAQTYERLIRRFETQGNVQPFTLPPEAVLKRVVHALESRHPRVRYPVTIPTYVFAWAKRLLSNRWFDHAVGRVG